MKGYEYDIAGTKVDNVIRKASKRKPIVICLIILFLIIIGVALALLLTGVIDSPINLNKAKTEDTSGSKNGDSNNNSSSNNDSNNNNNNDNQNNNPTSNENEENGNSGSENVDPQSGNNNSEEGHDHEHEDISENIIYDDFQIHFLELGNKYTGDSTYIKAGDTDILIDAGSRGNSATTLTNYVKKYCTDGKLEYVISTHGHQDHISGFAGNSDSKAKNFKGETVGKTGVLYYFEVGTFIDFAYKGEGTKAVDNKTQVSSSYGASTEYGKYLAAREYAISKGTTWFTAKELWDNNNASFELADGITMDILYNYYYFNTSTDENNYSVISMFNYNDHHFLLTGDLEKDGEEKFVAHYNNIAANPNLPHCDLFKGGHHGSYTASNEVLLNAITPDICCVCCCAGATEYTANYKTQFPAQDFINRIAKHTARVYVTTMFDEVNKTNVSMNGNIIVSFNGTTVGLKASNNLTKLKDTAWFNEEIYVNSSGNNVSGKAKEDFFTAETDGVTKVKRRIWPSYGVR